MARRRRIAFAAATLTRPEGAMAFAVYVVAQAISTWWPVLVGGGSSAREAARSGMGRQILPDVAIVSAVVAAHLAFRAIAYDGELLPNTYFAKIGGALNSAPPRLYVYHGLAIPFGGAIGVLAALAGILLDAVMSSPRAARDRRRRGGRHGALHHRFGLDVRVAFDGSLSAGRVGRGRGRVGGVWPLRWLQLGLSERRQLPF